MRFEICRLAVRPVVFEQCSPLAPCKTERGSNVSLPLRQQLGDDVAFGDQAMGSGKLVVNPLIVGDAELMIDGGDDVARRERIAGGKRADLVAGAVDEAPFQ